MNDMSVKPASLIDPQQANNPDAATATAVAGLASSFKDLVARVSVNLDSGLSDISDKSGIAVAGDNIQSGQRADDRPVHDDDAGRDRFGDRNADDRSDRNEPQRADRSDHDARDNGPAHRDDNRDPGRESHDTAHDDRPDEPAARADEPGGDDRQGQETASDHSGAGSDRNQTAGRENGGADQQQTHSADAGQQGPQAQTLTAQAAAGTLDAMSVIGAVGGVVQTEQAQVAEPGKAAATVQPAQAQVAEPGKAAATVQLAADATGAQKQSGGQTARNRDGQHQGQGAQNQQVRAAVQQQSDPNAKAVNNLQQQTAQLAQTLGQDAKVKVDVAVAQESETLSSRPTATLSAASALNSENKGPNQSGRQTLRQTAAGNHNPQAQVGAAQAQSGQAQIQHQLAGGGAQQAQAGIQATTANTSAGSGGVHSAGPAAAGAEQANAANAANANAGAQQTQQSQQAQQTAQTARPHQPMPSSVAEQVSVKITKALQAGQDRITIRLNPAELGRVEVKMELTHDGRTTAVVTADNRDTLDLLRRDSSDLQKALEEGGMRLSDSDLTFNLRGEEGQTAEDGDGQGGGGEEEEMADGFVEQEPEIIVAHEGGILINGRLDVRA